MVRHLHEAGVRTAHGLRVTLCVGDRPEGLPPEREKSAEFMSGNYSSFSPGMPRQSLCLELTMTDAVCRFEAQHLTWQYTSLQSPVSG